MLNDNKEIVGRIERQENFSFARNTTYGCGGVAKAAFFPSDKNQAAAIFSALVSSGERFCVLGAGSNVLAQDGFYDGYVISTARLDGITQKDFQTIKCGSGVRISSLLNFCKNKSLTGLEYLAGIPASVGGAAFMNAGAAGEYIQKSIKSVNIFDGKFRTLSCEECKFDYKHSTMRDINCIILSVELHVEASCGSDIDEKISYYLGRRKGLPCGRSCGCVFENYSGISAGKIIEGAGLKGAAIGGAVVSAEHGNFIINMGAKSAEVYELIQFVKSEVYRKLGLNLKEEVCYIGDFK